MEVKPGNVLISLSRIALSLSRTKKSTRDKPLQPSARYAFLLLCCKFLRKVRHLMERVCKPLKFRFYICLHSHKILQRALFHQQQTLLNGITHNGTLYFFSYNTFFNYNLFIFFLLQRLQLCPVPQHFWPLLTPTEEPAFAGFTNTG